MVIKHPEGNERPNEYFDRLQRVESGQDASLPDHLIVFMRKTGNTIHNLLFPPTPPPPRGRHHGGGGSGRGAAFVRRKWEEEHRGFFD